MDPRLNVPDNPLASTVVSAVSVMAAMVTLPAPETLTVVSVSVVAPSFKVVTVRVLPVVSDRARLQSPVTFRVVNVLVADPSTVKLFVPAAPTCVVIRLVVVVVPNPITDEAARLFTVVDVVPTGISVSVTCE